MARWLWAAALGVESAPLIALLERPRPRGPRLVVGRIGAHDVAVCTVGVGPDKARRRTAAALDQWRPDHVVSVGTCGALVGGLAPGTVITAHRLGEDAGEPADSVPLGQLRRVHVVTVREAVWEPSRRAALAACGGEVCEMEATGVVAAVLALAEGRPTHHAVKVVSDMAGGEPDPIIGPAGIADPVRIARFKARALALSRRHLGPALVATLSPSP